ncbi:L-aspartate oxidase [Neobacillus sp. 114]|uniref:L-aspartate oxidase n=1 Tax=Neobacillus sp. 114 TaxID=3048535 RepID=UPI0024C37DE9|nr:L-aspartate oxidase [Neobacillus sp. 114]
MTKSDVVIIGSGIAALQLAVHLSENNNVRVLTKSKLRTANSYLAQGGIAAAIGPADHPEKHVEDTLEAGAFHNDPEAVREIIYEAPNLIQEISKVFDRDSDGKLQLGMEGAHSEHRIVHAGGDATGKNVVEYLISKLKAHITVEEDTFAYELVINPVNNHCIGVKVKDSKGNLKVHFASHIILATGGCGQLYRYTSNAQTVNGDGIALAYRAGADIIDMEFIQFHPTLLYVNGETKGLISEAVRGEGANLISVEGTPIMEGVHPLGDLAPRHIVSQTIYDYLKNGHKVFLDITNVRDFEVRFPTITELCENNGIHLTEGKIPVVPGSHFLMGGIKTDLIGRTSIQGLYAIGESACTGLHGANRLASNSLLEGLYHGKKLADWINKAPTEIIPAISVTTKSRHTHKKLKLPSIQQIKNSMMDQVGIVRNELALTNQKKWLEQFKIDELQTIDSFSKQELTKIFMLITAKLITESALKRTESRGGHFRSDYPIEDNQNWLQKSIIHTKKEVERNHEQIKTALTT